MSPRMKLAVLFGGARAALASGRPLSRRQLLDLSAALEGWAGALLLPLLTPEQRVQMARGDLPGMAQLFLALRELLLAYPDLQKAIDMGADAFEALRQKGLELLTICKRAEDIAAAAQDAQAALTEQLEHVSEQIVQTIERLRGAETTAPADRGLLTASLAGLERYRVRQDERQRSRRARTRRALAPLREAAGRTSARRAVARLSSSILLGAGGSPATPGGHDTDARALLPISTPATDPPEGLPRGETGRRPRRRGPAPGRLFEQKGAPLDRCLDAPLERFLACAAELQAARDGLAGLGLTPEQPRAPDTLGSLQQADEALVLGQALRGSPLLQKETGQTPERIDELCGLLSAFATLQESAEALLRGAEDARLAVGTLLLLCCEASEEWAEARLRDPAVGDADRTRLRVEIATVRGARERAGEPARRQQARTQRLTRALAQEVAEATEEERTDAVIERLRTGAPVPAADLVAADTVQRRRARRDAELGAAPKGRKRRR